MSKDRAMHLPAATGGYQQKQLWKIESGEGWSLFCRGRYGSLHIGNSIAERRRLLLNQECGPSRCLYKAKERHKSGVPVNFIQSACSVSYSLTLT